MSRELVILVLVATVAIALLVVIAIVMLALRAQARRRAAYDEWLTTAGLRAPSRTGSVRASHDDIDFSYRFVDERNRGTVLRFSIDHSNLGHATVRRERGADRLFKRIGLVAEAQTRDQRFDDRYFIESSEPVFARALLSRAEARRAIDSLFACGFERVILDDQGIHTEMDKPGATTGAHRCAGDVVSALHALGVDQPAVPEHLGRDLRRRWRVLLGVLYTCVALLAAGGLGGIFLVSHEFRPLDGSAVLRASLPLSLTLGVIVSAALLILVRGRSTSARHLFALTWIAVPSIVCGGYVAYAWFNAARDTSPLVMHELAVLGKTVTHGRVTSYRIEVPAWRSINTVERITVDSALYYAVTPRQSRVRLGTRAGHLDFEWLAVMPQAMASAPGMPTAAQQSSGLKRYE